MARNHVSRSGMLLLELMIAIMIFSLAASVCVQVFVKAHELTDRADDLAAAVNHCGSAGEILRWADSPEEGLTQLKKLYPQLEQGEASAWADLEAMTLEIRWQADAGMTEYTIACLDSRGSTVYELICLGEGSP